MDWEFKTDSDLVTTQNQHMVDFPARGFRRKLNGVTQGDRVLIHNYPVFTEVN